jgi:protein subunit release factor B
MTFLTLYDNLEQHGKWESRDFNHWNKVYLEQPGVIMLTFAVSEEKNRWLKEKMEALKIHEKDLLEKFVRSSGKGGQKVNKTSTCVYLKHVPTGVEVKCMRDRSQSINRFLARRELIEKIETLSGNATCRDVRVEKIQKQKAKRIKRIRIKREMSIKPL